MLKIKLRPMGVNGPIGGPRGQMLQTINGENTRLGGTPTIETKDDGKTYNLSGDDWNNSVFNGRYKNLNLGTNSRVITYTDNDTGEIKGFLVGNEAKSNGTGQANDGNTFGPGDTLQYFTPDGEAGSEPITLKKGDTPIPYGNSSGLAKYFADTQNIPKDGDM